MTSPTDSPGAMWTSGLDERTADLLLAGQLAPHDGRQEVADLARLLRALAAAPPSEELAGRGEAVAAAVRLTGVDDELRSLTAERARARGGLRRVLTAAAVGTMLLSTAGLASAGMLPSPVQRAISRVARTVGIQLPNPDLPATQTAVEIVRVAPAEPVGGATGAGGVASPEDVALDRARSGGPTTDPAALTGGADHHRVSPTSREPDPSVGAADGRAHDGVGSGPSAIPNSHDTGTRPVMPSGGGRPDHAGRPADSASPPLTERPHQSCNEACPTRDVPEHGREGEGAVDHRAEAIRPLR